MNAASLRASKATFLLVASLLSVTVFLTVSLRASRAVAADEPETPQYRGLLNEAVSEYDARRYEEARALFRRAHELSPNARTLRGIGMASFELREYVEALRALEASLTEQRRPLTAPQRQQVEGLLERTRAFVGRYVVKLTPTEAALRVDGAPVSLEPDGTLLLSFGRHVMSAEAPGRLNEVRDLNVIGGERQEIAFHLRAAPTEAVEPPPPLPPVERPVAPPSVDLTQKTPDKAGQGSAVGWFVGAGVALAGTAAGVIWWKNRSDAYDQCKAVLDKMDPGQTCDNLDKVNGERKLALGVTIGLGAVTAALAVVGIVNLPKSDQGAASAGKTARRAGARTTAVACAPDVGGMSCALRMVF